MDILLTSLRASTACVAPRSASAYRRTRRSAVRISTTARLMVRIRLAGSRSRTRDSVSSSQRAPEEARRSVQDGRPIGTGQGHHGHVKASQQMGGVSCRLRPCLDESLVSTTSQRPFCHAAGRSTYRLSTDPEVFPGCRPETCRFCHRRSSCEVTSDLSRFMGIAAERQGLPAAIPPPTQQDR